jgi:predicted acyltransferase
MPTQKHFFKASTPSVSSTDKLQELPENSAYPQKSKRLLSLDALRGFDMFWIISGEGIFHGFANVVMEEHSLVRNPTDWTLAPTKDLSVPERLAVGISNQLHHTPWNGFTFYDMIFPLFIFIAGVSMPYSFDKYLNQAEDKSSAKKTIYLSLLKRTLLLIVLGTVVNGLLQWRGYENIRFASVLGRIGLACFFAALIYLNNSLPKQILWFTGILIGYWLIMLLVPVPGFGAGIFTPEGNLSGYVDRLLLPGKLHRTVYDPEGLLSTIPAIASAMLGIFAGQFLKSRAHVQKPLHTLISLLAGGAALLLVGLIWNTVFPINKNMWTSSFVLFAGGWSVLLFALFYGVIDVAGYANWSKPFIWIGTNSILIYMAAHGVFNFESTSQFLFGGIINKTEGAWQQVGLWIGVLAIQLMILQFLFRKKWFLKI